KRDGNYEIYSMNDDGSGVTRLTNNTVSDLDPSWSPDGAKIVFSSARDEPDPACRTNCNYEIYSMDAGGGSVTRLTNDPGSDFGPAWSQDGTTIAFARSSNFEDVYINTINAD